MDIKSPVGEARNEYTYSAGGQKLKVVQKWNPNYSTAPVIGSGINVSSLTVSLTTDYVGNKIYENNTLKRILIDGGYIEGGKYYYYLTDHLGNNRAVVEATGTVIQRTHYYPFGMAFAETIGENKQPYKYNGKELDRRLRLNTYDYSARYLDNAVPRFTTMDPHSENYYSWSPYAYVGNNPLRLTDPTGMDWFVDNETGNMHFFRGVRELTSELSDTYSLGNISKYQNLGSDQMFGEKVTWKKEENLLDNFYVNLGEDSEPFMRVNDYAKAEVVNIEEYMHKAVYAGDIGGRGRKDDSQEVEGKVKQIGDASISYVKPGLLNTIANEQIQRTFYFPSANSLNTATYELTKPYGASNGDNRLLRSRMSHRKDAIKNIQNSYAKSINSYMQRQSSNKTMNYSPF